MMLPHLASASLFTLLSLTPLVRSFTDTSPLLVFSHAPGAGEIPFLSSSPSPSVVGKSIFAKPHNIAKEIVKHSKVCNLDGVAIVTTEQPSESSLLRSLALQSTSSAPHSRLIPHVLDAHGSAADEIQKAILRACKGWSVIDADAHQEDSATKGKIVLRIEDAGDAESTLTTFASTFKNNVIILTTPPTISSSRLTKRSTLVKDGAKDEAGLPYGLFAEYQFFTSGLLLLILIFGILLLPAVKIATSLLSAIETPDRMGDAKMGGPGKDKNQ